MTARTAIGRADYGEDDPELYETPYAATRALLAADPFFRRRRRIWEPACGPGKIVAVLAGEGHEVRASDKYDYRARWMMKVIRPVWGNDFLEPQCAPHGVQAIVTNPPYSKAAAFAAEALIRAPRVYLLLELGFQQGGQGCPHRDRLFDDGHWTGYFPLRERLQDMNRDGWAGEDASQSRRHAWFRFERGADRPWPETRRISIKPFMED